jgi:predicted transcriptional regulator
MKDVCRNNNNNSEYAEAVEAIKEGMASFDRGEGRPARETLTGILQKQEQKKKN